jgi:hypothetical protein
MDWKRVADQAKQVINKRGGTESLKEDAGELRNIAEGPGTLSEKAKRAAEAIREPGAHREPGEPLGGTDDADEVVGGADEAGQVVGGADDAGELVGGADDPSEAEVSMDEEGGGPESEDR